MNTDDLNIDGWTETHTVGAVKLVGDGRLLLMNSGLNSAVIIAGLPPGGSGSRPAVTVEARDLPALIAALQELHQQRKDNQP